MLLGRSFAWVDADDDSFNVYLRSQIHMYPNTVRKMEMDTRDDDDDGPSNIIHIHKPPVIKTNQATT